MPKPTIDALPIDLGRHSATLLGLGLELGLQAGELGKGRIRVGLFFPLAAVEPDRSRRPAVLLASGSLGPFPALLAFRAPPMARRSLRPARGGADGLLGRYLRILRLRLARRRVRRRRRFPSQR